MSHTYEVEIKSLLGSKEAAEKLKSSLKSAYPDTKLVGQGKQLNHYFNTPADTAKLIHGVEALVPAEKKAAFEKILKEGKKISLRTRDADGTVILVMKASVGDDSSSNGVTRIEFESKVNKSLAELDQLLLDSGATYQAKWSREREEYAAGDMHICLDKNAGYGYLAEFERVTPDESSLTAVKNDLLAVMAKLGAVELPQDRLERMFAHYNANWRDYYGTEKTFQIE
ncbi:MAG: CYTH domain-containing protein [Patescibacteria group bacterium]